MNTSTNQIIANLGPSIISGIAEGTKIAANAMWTALANVFAEYWLYILITLFVFMAIATIKASFVYWGMLGSLLYHIVYFVMLVIIGLIWGPEIFFSNIYNAIGTVLLYRFSYYITGKFLELTGFKKVTR